MIRISMVCSRTVAAACCSVILLWASSTNMNRPTLISVRLSCIWAKLVWNVRVREPQRRRFGRRKNSCHLCRTANLPKDSSAAGKQRSSFIRNFRPMNASRLHLNRSSTSSFSCRAKEAKKKHPLDLEISLPPRQNETSISQLPSCRCVFGTMLPSQPQIRPKP